MNIMQHVALVHNSNGVISWPEIKILSENLIEEYGIRGEPSSLAQNLSGGNQQRLMLSLIPKETQVLLLEQPTRGLDVQSASYIWSNLIESRLKKVITIFSSVDLTFDLWSQSIHYQYRVTSIMGLKQLLSQHRLVK